MIDQRCQLPGRAGDAGRIGDVDFEELRLPACGELVESACEFSRGLLSGVGPAGADDHLKTMAHELPRHFEADALVGAGDQSDFLWSGIHQAARVPAARDNLRPSRK